MHEAGGEGAEDKEQIYSQTTLIFHVDSRNRPLTTGFSARQTINFPSSSTVGEKLSSDLVVLFRISSLKVQQEKNRKINFFLFQLFFSRFNRL